jgi:hypothetical protein
MKKIDFTQAGGFPLEERTLHYMQTSYYEVLQAVIGHFGLPDTGNFIISGCELVGGNITAGMMYIEGKLCPWTQAAGSADTKIMKVETVGDAPFEAVGNLPTYYDYRAMENSDGVALSEFVRLPKVQELENQTIHWGDVADKPAGIVIDTAVAPALTLWQRMELLEKKAAVFTAGGGMVLWNKPANLIPWGWHEVVDWRGRMPVGMNITVDSSGTAVDPEFRPDNNIYDGTATPGRTGGNKNAVLINHSHALVEGGRSIATVETNPANGTRVNGSSIATVVIGNTGTESYGVSGGSAVADGTSKNLPPYRTVLFIEYTGVA